MLATALCLFACQKSQEKKSEPSVGRFAAVAKPKKATNISSFCEVLNSADKAPKFERPTFQALPPGITNPSKGNKDQPKWTWVNVWASWCAPCVEEIPLFRRWQKALSDKMEFEFWSMDEDGAKLVQSVEKLNPMPGSVGWFDSPESVPKFFGPLGIAPMSPIPVHVLVDPQGRTRCVRVGKVAEDAYGSIRAFVSGN